MASLVLTLIGPDRPGLVEMIAQTIADHGGNWLESRMSRLAGQFAGILRAEVPEDRAPDLEAALRELADRGLRVVVEQSQAGTATDARRALSLELVGTDRPGIIREISQALAARGVNVDELHTECSTAPMSGEALFKATARLHAPPDLTDQELGEELEKISADMMVHIELTREERLTG
ncbi:ACT domain-containing protein [Myxococcota bacterium]|nr:ACT domain-containing protein [Myxococcota bacterium]